MPPRQLCWDKDPDSGMSPSFLAPKCFPQGKLCGKSKQVGLNLTIPGMDLVTHTVNTERHVPSFLLP